MSPTLIYIHSQYGSSEEAVHLRYVRRTGATLTVMPDGEHWFHTQEQMAFLDGWIRENEVTL